MRNTLVTGNDVGLSATRRVDQPLQRRVRQPRTADYDGARGCGRPIWPWRSPSRRSDDLRLAPAAAHHRPGDPADDFGNEPVPNGGRINIGAFGNTPFAELSATEVGKADAGAADGGVAGGDAAGGPGNEAGGANETSKPAAGCGCEVGGAAPGGGVLLGLGLVVFGLLRRRR